MNFEKFETNNHTHQSDISPETLLCEPKIAR